MFSASFIWRTYADAPVSMENENIQQGAAASTPLHPMPGNLSVVARFSFARMNFRIAQKRGERPMKTAMPEKHWYLGNLPRQIHLWAHEGRISALQTTIMPEMPQNPQNSIFCD